MATVSLPALLLPDALVEVFGAPAFSAGLLMDASGEKAAAIIQAPKTGSVRKVHFRTGAVTTATDTDIRLETVDATTGAPTGTLFGTTTNVTVASASITANTWITTGNLTADASVTKGDIFAVVLVPTGTPNYRMSLWNTGYNFPYAAQFTASWSVISALAPVVALEYSDGSFAYTPGTMPIQTVNTHTIGSGTDPDEIALKFTPVAPIRVCGFWIHATADGDYSMILYDSDASTVLESLAVDKDKEGSASARPSRYLFDTAISLSAGSAYFLSVQPSSATTLAVYSFDVASAGILDTTSGGQAFHYREAVNGTWDAAITTRRPLFGLIVDGIDDGAGSGGGGQRIFGG